MTKREANIICKMLSDEMRNHDEWWSTKEEVTHNNALILAKLIVRCFYESRLNHDPTTEQNAVDEKIKETHEAIKAEAIKEFAERLKEKFKCGDDVLYEERLIYYKIDDLVKEMVGEL